MRTSLLFTFVFVLLGCCAVVQAKDGFREWVEDLKIHIENVTAKDVGDGIKSLYIERMDIYGIKLATIQSFYPRTGSKYKSSYGLKVSGISVHLAGKMRVEIVVLGKVGADFDADIKNAGVELGLDFVPDSDGLIKEAQMPKFELTYTKDDIKLVVHEIEPGYLDALARPTIQGLGPSILSLLRDLINEKVQQKLDELCKNDLTDFFMMVNEYIHEFKATKDPLVLPVNIEPSDLRKSPVIDAVRFVTTHLIGVEGDLNLTYVVSLFLDDNGLFSLHDILNKSFVFDINIDSLNANLTIGLDDVTVEGLDSWRELQLLVPTDPVTLESYTDMESLKINVTWWIGVSIGAGGMIQTEKYLEEHAQIAAAMHENTLNLTVQLASPTGVAGTYSNTMCMDVECLKALINAEGTGLTFFALGTLFDYIQLTADTGDLENDVRELFNKLVAMFVDNYKEQISPALNGAVLKLGLTFINDLLSGLLENATCEERPDIIDPEWSAGATMGSIAGAAAASVLLGIVPVMYSRKHKLEDEEDAKEVEMNAMGAAGAGAAAGSEPTYCCKPCGPNFCRNWVRTDKDGASLFLDPRLPVAFRVLMPFLILLAICFFISSNTGVGASVYIYLFFGDKEVVLPSMFDFGLMNTVEQMWDAGAYPLSVLIFVMSGFWPYCKLVLMLFTWFTPQPIMSSKARGRMLSILDAFGKFSLLDTYVMIMMLVAFHFDIVFSQVGEDVELPTRVVLYVYPAYGFVMLMFSTLISLLMSHLCYAGHLYVLHDKHVNEGPAEEKISMMNCTPGFFGTGFGKVLMCILMIINAVLCMIGSLLQTFSFDFKGLAGWAFQYVGVDAHREYSVFSMNAEVPPAAYRPNSFTIRATQAVYMLTAFILPLVHVVFMFFYWVLPLSRKAQSAMHFGCEILYAWSCLDVFIISIVAAVLQIQQVAGFMVGDMCDFLTPYMDRYFGHLLDGYLSCFDVIAQMKSGCYLLIVAAILYTFVHLTLVKVTKKSLEERKNKGPSNSAPTLTPAPVAPAYPAPVDREVPPPPPPRSAASSSYGGAYDDASSRSDEDFTPMGAAPAPPPDD